MLEEKKSYRGLSSKPKKVKYVYLDRFKEFTDLNKMRLETLYERQSSIVRKVEKELETQAIDKDMVERKLTVLTFLVLGLVIVSLTTLGYISTT